jgi:acetyl-CoA carboxylase beta subunit
MACSCTQRKKKQYLWTSADGSETMTYNTEIEAKAKVLTKGGTYTSVARVG